MTPDAPVQEGLVRAAENCTEADLSTLSVVNALKMVLLNQVRFLASLTFLRAVWQRFAYWKLEAERAQMPQYQSSTRCLISAQLLVLAEPLFGMPRITLKDDIGSRICRF